MASVNSARSAVTTCCSVRCVTTVLMLSLTVSPRRALATSSVPPVALVVAAQIMDAPLHVEIHLQLFLLARQEMLRRIHLREDALVEAADLVDQGNPEMQPRLEVRVHDFAADRFDGELALAHREYAGAHHQNERRPAPAAIYSIRFCISVPHARARDPRPARPGSPAAAPERTVIVSLGIGDRLRIRARSAYRAADTSCCCRSWYRR